MFFFFQLNYMMVKVHTRFIAQVAGIFTSDGHEGDVCVALLAIFRPKIAVCYQIGAARWV